MTGPEAERHPIPHLQWDGAQVNVTTGESTPALLDQRRISDLDPQVLGDLLVVSIVQ
jgi:hypothetical protein